MSFGSLKASSAMNTKSIVKGKLAQLLKTSTKKKSTFEIGNKEKSINEKSQINQKKNILQTNKSLPLIKPSEIERKSVGDGYDRDKTKSKIIVQVAAGRKVYKIKKH